jgi:hypothetical protein
MGFWLRKSIFGAVLVIIALVLMSNLDVLFNFDLGFSDDKAPVAEKMDATEVKPAEPETTPIKQSPSKNDSRVIESTNAAADGLSKFYASINPSLSNGQTRIRHGVVTLPDPKGKLETILEAKRMVTRPFPKTWKGEKKNRAFRKNHTLYQKLDEYAKEEGLELVWWINKDLVIKDPFRINKEILGTAFQIGQALNGHFPNGVSTYFCYKQRNLVVVEGRRKYLDNECRLLDFNKY